jgi:hypothetical protein
VNERQDFPVSKENVDVYLTYPQQTDTNIRYR